MDKECKHKNKAYSDYGISTNSSHNFNWICRDCGFEGSESTKRESEYEEIKRKFNK